MALSLTAAVGMNSFGATRTWDGEGSDNSWHTAANWSEDTVPVAGDTAIIDGNFDVVISSDDAVCEILEMDTTDTLTIIGKKLTLGDPNGDSESTIDGRIYLEKSGSTPGELSLHNWVTFHGVYGTGYISASKGDDTDREGRITRASGSGGLKTEKFLTIEGHLWFLASLDGPNGTANMIVNHADDTMMFGTAVGPDVSPDIVISGDDSAFDVSAGLPQFHHVDFGTTAPDWYVDGSGEIHVSDRAAQGYFEDVPFNVECYKPGTLDFDHDFSCTGQLTVHSGGAHQAVIQVAEGCIVRFYTPDP